MLTAAFASTPVTYTQSTLDRAAQARHVWIAAFAMARRMIKPRNGHSTGEALTWFLDAGFRRFGFNALPIVRAAGWAAFNAHHVTKAATGTPAELARQGMLTRCVRLEPAPRGGWSWAWTHDPLAAVNLNRGHRAYRARQLREQRAEDAARRREVARGLAADRLALDGRDLYALTDAGKLVLEAARVY